MHSVGKLSDLGQLIRPTQPYRRVPYVTIPSTKVCQMTRFCRYSLHTSACDVTDSSFSTAAPLTWNSLPPAVLYCDFLSTLNSRLKTHLFSILLSSNYSTYLFRQRLCSRLTAIWRYINFVLLLLLLQLYYYYYYLWCFINCL